MRRLLWVFIALLAVEAAAAAQPAGAKDSSSIGYPTVASALDGMRSKSGVRVSNQDGWTVIEDGSTMSIWSFTPAGHPAHPAVVRRTVVQQGSDISVQMATLCEAKKIGLRQTDGRVSRTDEQNARKPGRAAQSLRDCTAVGVG